MIKRNGFVLLIFFSFALATVGFAQSGRAVPEPTTTPATTKSETSDQLSADTQNLEPVRLVTYAGFESLLQELNKFGKIGYRLDKAINYGGEGAGQTFAAILKLDAASATGSGYEYDWLTSPDKNLLETRLNARAGKGFNLVRAFAFTNCGKQGAEIDSESTPGSSAVLSMLKGDVYLVEKRRETKEQTKEYKVFIGKLGLGKNPTEKLQAALDAAPPGYRPVNVLFTRASLLDFSISIILEKDIQDKNPSKIEYKFLKEENGFEKKLNALAKDGFRILSGRRIGVVKMALLAKESSEPTVYSLIEEEKYAQEFPRDVEQGNVYQGVLAGDLTCGSREVSNEKIIFAQKPSGDGKKYDYKILTVSDVNAPTGSDKKLSEVKALLNNGYQIKDLFYFNGLNVIFEK